MNLTEQLKADILKHAEQEFPNESCGVIVNGTYIPCRNDSADKLNHFKINNTDKDRAEDDGEIQAYVHSHPNAFASPSDHDLLSIEKHKKPWIICSLPDIDFSINYPHGYKAPLIGRKFYHGWQDCYTLIADFYAREFGITLKNFDREDGWWTKEKNQNLYQDNYEAAGFREVSNFKYGDVLLFKIRSDKMNHAAIFLDSQWKLKSEESEMFVGNMLFLHHMYGSLSKREILSNYWVDRMVKILRHKDLIND